MVERFVVESPLGFVVGLNVYNEVVLHSPKKLHAKVFLNRSLAENFVANYAGRGMGLPGNVVYHNVGGA